MTRKSQLILDIPTSLLPVCECTVNSCLQHLRPAMISPSWQAAPQNREPKYIFTLKLLFIRHSVPALKKETNTLWKRRPSRLEMRGKCKDSRLCLVIRERGGFSLSSCEPLVAAVGGVKSNPDFDFTRLRMFTYQDAMSGSLGYPPPKENRPL